MTTFRHNYHFHAMMLFKIITLSVCLLAQDAAAIGTLGHHQQLIAESPVPPCSDEAWRSPEVQHLLAPALRRAEIYAKSKLPIWDQAAYMKFSRDGRREAGEKMIRQRLEPLTTLVLAECMENNGRFLPAVERVLIGLSRQQPWTLPAHDPGLTNLHGNYSVDLNACETAHDAAWALRLMSPRLNQDVRENLVNALNEHIFRPLRRTLEQQSHGGSLGPHWWIEGKSNWNAVCVSGVVGAAYAMRRNDLEYWLKFGRKVSRHYLESFRDDGYSDEGPSYWNYGFGAYLRLRETLLWAEPQQPDLLSNPKARMMATYPARITMPGDAVAPFGDTPSLTRIDPVKRAHAEVAIGWITPGSWATLARPTSSGGRLNHAVWRLWGRPAMAHGKHEPDLHSACSLFPISGVVVLRPNNSVEFTGRLSLTLRTGGSKAHAHDDAGSYALAMNGVIVAGDLGAPVYTKDTFGPLRRKNLFVNSYGHPVPVVGGHLQLDATQHQARWAMQPCAPAVPHASVAVIDLMPVYDVPELQMLRRDFKYDEQTGGFVAIIDRFSSRQPISFETAIVTRGTVTRQENSLVIESEYEKLIIDVSASAPLDIKLEVIEDQQSNRATRIALRLRYASSTGCIAYRFQSMHQEKILSSFSSCQKINK